MNSKFIILIALLAVAFAVPEEPVTYDCSTVPEPSEDWCTYCMTQQKTNLVCNECDATNKYANFAGNLCVAISCATPLTYTDDFCSACDVEGSHAGREGLSCTTINCDAEQVITQAYCSECRDGETVANIAKTDCIVLDCQTTPNAGEYSDDWCLHCFEDTIFASADKTKCQATKPVVEIKDTQQNSTTSGRILTIISAVSLLIASL